MTTPVSTPTSAIDLLAEQPRISLTALAQREGVHVATVFRWRGSGLRGHRLETFRIGHRVYTTQPAWERFVAATNGEPVVAGETPRQRERAIDRAEAELARLGA